MYTNTATDTMNSAIISLDVFEEVNGFEEEPEDDYNAQYIDGGENGIHFDLIL